MSLTLDYLNRSKTHITRSLYQASSNTRRSLSVALNRANPMTCRLVTHPLNYPEHTPTLSMRRVFCPPVFVNRRQTYKTGFAKPSAIIFQFQPRVQAALCCVESSLLFGINSDDDDLLASELNVHSTRATTHTVRTQQKVATQHNHCVLPDYYDYLLNGAMCVCRGCCCDTVVVDDTMPICKSYRHLYSH